MPTPALNKSRLDLSLQDDRKKALEAAVEAHGGQLSSTIRRLIQDQAEAEDVLQDVFEELITAYDLGLTIERLSAWLMTVARHKALDRFRRKKTRTDYEQAASHQSGFTSDESERTWLREEILNGLELLPKEQRQVFVMYELEGKSFKEIAAELKVPIGTLMARKKYAVDFLRDYLQEIYNGNN